MERVTLVFPGFSCIRILKILHCQLLLLHISMQTKQDPRNPGDIYIVLLMALEIILHAKLCLSVIIFPTCVCWHPERICRALWYSCSPSWMGSNCVYTMRVEGKLICFAFAFKPDDLTK